MKKFYLFLSLKFFIAFCFVSEDHNAQCLEDYTYTMSPPPVDGTYGPNETVTFCFTVETWSTLESEWLHGIELSIGEGWDINSVVAVPADDLSGSGSWGWYPDGINGGFGSGFYYNYTFPMDMNPANNYGDFATGPWTFCWSITTVDGTDLSLDGANLDITVNTLGDGESGSWITIGCDGDPILDPPFPSILSLCDLNAGNDSTITVCSTGLPFELFNSINGIPDTGGTWLDPNNNFFSGIFNPEISIEGIYTYTVENLNCGASSFIDVSLINPPSSTISGNANICNGENATLTIASTGYGPFDIAYTDGNSNFNLTNIPALYTFDINPSSNTTYSLLSMIDSLNQCEGIVSGSAQVNVANIPTGLISGGGTFCLGETGEILFEITGGSNYNLTYWDGAVENSLLNIVDGHIENFSPEFNSTFSLVEIYPVGFPACTANELDGSAVFVVNVSPILTNVIEECTSENDGYIVSFDINGGDGSSYFELGGNGSISSNLFTSDFIATGSDYTFTIDDANGCGPVNVDGNNFCPCTSQAGTMEANLIEVCTDQTAFAVYNGGETLDGNDELIFILHDNSGNSLGNMIATSPTPDFDFDGLLMNSNTTYYISAVVSNPDYINDPCISVSLGTPVIFNEIPSAIIDGNYEFCEGSAVDIEIVFEGDGPYEFNYSLDGFEIGTLISNDISYSLNVSLEGVYEIISISNNACSSIGIGTAVVSEINAPSSSIIGNADICSNNNTGLAVTFDGTSPFTLLYAIDGVEQPSIVTNDDNYFLNVNSTGNYSLISVTDNNCFSDLVESQEVILHSSPTAQITGGGEICQGGQVEFTVSLEGESPYNFTYSINNADEQFIVTNENVYTFLSTTEGVYSLVEVEDQFCIGDIIGLPSELVVNPIPTASISVTQNPICNGENTSFVFNLTGNSPFDLTYSVDGDEQELSAITNGYSIEIAPTSTTNITLLNIVDNSINACENNYNIPTNVIVNNYPVIEPMEDVKVCSGENTNAIGIDSEPMVLYQWQPEAGIGDPNSSSTFFNLILDNTIPLTYNYTLTGRIGDCLTSKDINITVYPLPQPKFTYLPKEITTENTLVNFINTTPGYNNYIWDFDGEVTSQEVNLDYQFPNALEGIYNVVLTAIDTSIGCKNKYSETIFVKGDLLVYVPTAFTPNEDGINDLLYVSVKNQDPSYFHFRVYNRWNELIFESYEPDFSWNGTSDSKDFYGQSQVYIWKLEVKNRFSPSIKNFEGQVLLIR
jgi:gliding motility-associated-like protein